VRTASTWLTIGRRALPAGMLSRRIDASAKIETPRRTWRDGMHAGRRVLFERGTSPCRRDVTEQLAGVERRLLRGDLHSDFHSPGAPAGHGSCVKPPLCRVCGRSSSCGAARHKAPVSCRHRWLWRLGLDRKTCRGRARRQEPRLSTIAFSVRSYPRTGSPLRVGRENAICCLEGIVSTSTAPC
jgi:hypothetical protein